MRIDNLNALTPHQASNLEFPIELYTWDTLNDSLKTAEVVGYAKGLEYPWLVLDVSEDSYVGYRNAATIPVTFEVGKKLKTIGHDTMIWTIIGGQDNIVVLVRFNDDGSIHQTSKGIEVENINKITELEMRKLLVGYKFNLIEE